MSSCQIALDTAVAELLAESRLAELRRQTILAERSLAELDKRRRNVLAETLEAAGSVPLRVVRRPDPPRLVCDRCGQEVTRTANAQKFCEPCQPDAHRETNNRAGQRYKARRRAAARGGRGV